MSTNRVRRPHKPADVALKPGETCAQSGQYRNSKTHKQCTATRGEPMPPAPKGSTWKLTDASRHQAR